MAGVPNLLSALPETEVATRSCDCFGNMNMSMSLAFSGHLSSIWKQQVHKMAPLLASPVVGPYSLVQGQLATAWARCMKHPANPRDTRTQQLCCQSIPTQLSYRCTWAGRGISKCRILLKN